ncbi:zinc finger RNA-binding protein 2 isoform X1 [Pongo pygmaeus]|uniref:ZFR2 isoform 7 n=1 Tax=Pongo abelii TaxID=9601 RepID=A0A2J8SBM0_PONAB|nr:zinc finger RNA-binding protein 2 isoform X1 [Pongo pygmaeus]XP_054395328.1 zinc finger RNA-binding protein 2 isoform X8 [Pongo abelii]PNJ18165.1 ZFR2 isoform 7 [Pongo abelii]
MATSQYFDFAQGGGPQYSPEVETTPPALASGLPCALPWTVGCSGSDVVTALSPSLRGLACICSILWDPAW